jgi:NAD(P)H-dependent FMN reductase
VTVDLHDIEVVDQQLWNALAVADTVVFGCPTYRGGPSSVVKGVAEYFSLLAVQHGMPWANVDLLPGWWWAGASISDLNRLGGWLGVMSQSNGGSDLQTDPRESDLLTAEHLDARVAEVARLLRSGRTQLAQRDMASAGAHVSTDGEVGGSTLPAVSRDR